MIALKKVTPALIYGTVTQIDPENANVFAYTIAYKKKEFLVICNFSGSAVNFNTSIKDFSIKKVAIHNYNNQPTIKESTISLRPYKAIVYNIK